MDYSSYSPHATSTEIGQKVRHLHPVRAAMVAMQLNNLQLPFDRRASTETAGTKLPKGPPTGLPAIAERRPTSAPPMTVPVACRPFVHIEEVLPMLHDVRSPSLGLPPSQSAAFPNLKNFPSRGGCRKNRSSFPRSELGRTVGRTI